MPQRFAAEEKEAPSKDVSFRPILNKHFGRRDALDYYKFF
jgi:hypothetical protein